MSSLSHLRRWAVSLTALLAISASATEPSEIVSALAGNNSATWSNVRVPVRLTLAAGGTPISLSGNLTMVRDKSIFVSLRFWGFEVAQLNINADSVTAVVKRPNKLYVAESVEKYMHGLNLGVNTLQDLVMGRVLMPGGQLLDTASCDQMEAVCEETSSTSWTIAGRTQHRLYSLAYTAEEDTLTHTPYITAAVVTPKGHASVTCRYGRYVNAALGSMPQEASIKVDIKGKPYRLEADIQWEKAKWDQKSPATFNTDLSGYRRIELARILTLLTPQVQ